MDTKSSQIAVEQLKLMLASATATLELLQKQLASAATTLHTLSAEPSDLISAETPQKKPTKKVSRDTSRWKLDKRFYSKGRFLLEVFKKYVDKQMSLVEVENQFNSDVVFAGQTIKGNRVLYQLASDVKDPKRFHTDQVISTKDGKKLVVSTQFGTNNFPTVLRYLNRHFRIPLEMEGEDPYTNEWARLLE